MSDCTRSCCTPPSHSSETFESIPDAPIACTLAAVDVDKRISDLLTAFDHLVDSERFPGGFRWTFRSAPGIEALVRDLAEREHHCCPFLTLTVSSTQDTVIWEARASGEAAPVVDAFFRLPQTLSEVRHPLKDTSLAFFGIPQVDGGDS